MHTHVFFPNRPGTNFKIILDVSSFRSQNTPHPADAHSPDPLSSISSPTPSPAQPGLVQGQAGNVQSWLTLYWAALLILQYDY